ncbi:MAG: hypothetical protein WC125_10510 [Bacteroidales bacterium]
MTTQKITSLIKRVTVFCILSVFFAGCRLISTGTMVYDYRKEEIINFTPSPVLPGRYREVIIHSSPKNSCFFTMQTVSENNRKYTLIRRKDFTGKKLSSYKVMCSVFPESFRFAMSPDCDRIFITGCYLSGDNRMISCWCDLPEMLSEIEIHPHELPSLFNQDMVLDSSIFHRHHEFLSKDVLLVILKREHRETPSSRHEAYLATIDLTSNECHIIKQLKRDDGADFVNIDEEVGIKVNENGLAAILADHQLFIYNHLKKELTEGVVINRLYLESDFLEKKLNFLWISQDEICIWWRYDDLGRHVIYNFKTEKYRTGKLNEKITNWFTPSVCIAGGKIVYLHSNTKTSFPKYLGSRIYETFWLQEGVLGFTCDFYITNRLR